MPQLLTAPVPQNQNQWLAEALQAAARDKESKARMAHAETLRQDALMQASLQDQRRAFEVDRRFEFDRARTAADDARADAAASLAEERFKAENAPFNIESLGAGSTPPTAPEATPGTFSAGGSPSPGFSMSASGSTPAMDARISAGSGLGGVLSGKESVFASVGEKYGIEPTMLKAIASFETGGGTSNAVKTHNNVGGLMRTDDPSRFQSFSSVEEGIDAMGSLLKRNYIDKGLTTLEQIGAKYSPPGASNDVHGTNSGWAKGVGSLMKRMSPASDAASSASPASAAESYIKDANRVIARDPNLSPKAKRSASEAVMKATLTRMAPRELTVSGNDSGVFDTIDDAIAKARQYTDLGHPTAPVRDSKTGKWTVRFSPLKPDFDAVAEADRRGLVPTDPAPDGTVLYRNADGALFRASKDGFLGANPDNAKRLASLTTDEKVWVETMSAPTKGMDTAETVIKKAGLGMGVTYDGLKIAAEAGKITQQEATEANHWLSKFRSVNGIDSLKDMRGAKVESALARERAKLSVLSKKGIEVDPVMPAAKPSQGAASPAPSPALSTPGKLYAREGNSIKFASGKDFRMSVQQALDDGLISADQGREQMRKAGFIPKAK